MSKLEQIKKLREQGMSFEEALKKVMGREVSESYKKLMRKEE